MLVACWSVKGGVGTTVLAALLAVHMAREGDRSVVAVDMADDLGAALGAAANDDGSGVVDWWNAGVRAPSDALGGLAEPVADRLGVIGRGSGAWNRLDAAEVFEMHSRLRSVSDVVVVDCGRLDLAGADAAMATWIARHSDVSLMVARPCYLQLRRCVSLPVEPTGVVLMAEPGRSLGPADVARVTGIPVLAQIAVDASIARAVDAGLLASRMPRGVNRVLADIAAVQRPGSEAIEHV